jgi:hypothetical protein
VANYSAMTISGWFKGSNNGHVFSIGAGGVKIRFYVRATSPAFFNINSDINAYCYSNLDITDGNWHYFAGTYNKDAGSNNQKLYIDGVLQNNLTTNTGTINVSALDKLNIGALNNIGDFNGSIDDVRIYNRSLSASEISLLYLSSEHYNSEATLAGRTNYTYSVTGLTTGKKYWNVWANERSNVFGAWQASPFELTLNTCSPPLINNNWVARFEQNCNLTTYTNIGTGNLTIDGGPGNFTLFAGLKLKGKTQTCDTAPCNFILNPMLEFT